MIRKENPMKKYKKILAAVGGAFAAGITGMHYANVMISKHACKDELLYDQEGSFYSFRFGNIFYTKQGNGHPLLLIHQLHPTSSHIEFKSLTEELSAHYTVYTIDLLGCGRSDKPAITYTAYLYVQLINDFIKNVIGEPAHILASGISSTLPLLACSAQPDFYDKLILINPPALSISNRTPNPYRRFFKALVDLPVIGTFLYHISVSKKQITKILEKKVFYFPENGESSSYLLRQKEKCVAFLYEGAHFNGYGAKYLYSSLKACYLNANLVQAIQNIDHSIYVIMGKEEPDSLQTIKEYKALNCSIETAVLPKTKRVPHLENPGKFQDIVEIFLS
jgi:pimeloyl-ACP methyl ester carboxylesterase